MNKKDSTAHCSECGALLRDAGEFHPLAFCILKQGGCDPWETLLWINRGLGVDVKHWPKRPPLISELRSSSSGVAKGTQ